MINNKMSVPKQTDEFVQMVGQTIVNHITKAPVLEGHIPDLNSMIFGKMLRTRFAARLFFASEDLSRSLIVAHACAAIETIHSASLLHDDVIDGAMVRRGQPSLWRASTKRAAILIGDILFCESLGLIEIIEKGRYVSAFTQKVREMCATEIEQELSSRQKQLDEESYLKIARGKTGPLFAFLGQVCGGNDLTLTMALEEAGYLTGAAYQLADDVVDIVGKESIAGKTLGTDALRNKYTLPSDSEEGVENTMNQVLDCLEKAYQTLDPWPNYQKALKDFVGNEIEPVLARHGVLLNESKVLAS